MEDLITLNGLEIITFLNQRLGWVDVIVEGGFLSIEIMPYYFDRGRFLVKAFSDNQILFSLDDEDLFPRYYFAEPSLLIEVSKFIQAKNLKQKDIVFRKYQSMDDNSED